MYIPTSQRTLLTDILEAFEYKGSFSDRVLGKIYGHLFGQEAQYPSFSDPNLQDIVLALQEIIEAEQLTSLEAIVAYFDQEDKAIDEYAREISDDIIAAQDQKDRDEEDAVFAEEGIGIIEAQVQVKPALSRYVVTANRFKPDEFAQAFEKLQIRLVRYFKMQLRNQANVRSVEVEDLVQETVTLVWKKWRGKTFEKYSIEQLIFMKAKDVLYDWRKAEEKYSRIDGAMKLLEQVVEPPNQAQEAADQLKCIRMSMSTMEFDLCFFLAEGYSAKEIGDYYDLSPQSVRDRVYRIRQKLSSRFKLH